MSLNFETKSGLYFGWFPQRLPLVRSSKSIFVSIEFFSVVELASLLCINAMCFILSFHRMNLSELSVRSNRNGMSCLHISVDCRIFDVKVKHRSRDASISSPNALSHHVFKLFVFLLDLVVVFPHFWHKNPFVCYDYSNFHDNSPIVWRQASSLAISLECRCSLLTISILFRLILAFWHFQSVKKRLLGSVTKRFSGAAGLPFHWI